MKRDQVKNARTGKDKDQRLTGVAYEMAVDESLTVVPIRGGDQDGYYLVDATEATCVEVRIKGVILHEEKESASHMRA